MKKLAIIGANYLQKPLVLKAREMGIETHVFAWEEGAVCKEIADHFYPISILEKELILQKCTEIGIDGITSIASDAAVPTVCFVAEKMGLISNRFGDSLVATNKYEMRKRFMHQDVKCPRFEVATTDNLPDVSNFRFPVIVKPTDRSGSRGVLKIEHPKQLKEAVSRAQTESFSGEAIVEEFVQGREVSVESISWEGKHYILAITDKVTTREPYFVELEHHQPTSLDEKVQDKIRIETRKALTAVGVKYGAGHSEFIITNDNKVFAVEVGARMGGDFIGSDLVYLSTGYDFLKGVIDVALGKFEEPEFIWNKHSGIFFLSKETEFLKKIIENSDNFTEIVTSEIIQSDLKHVESSGDRSGYLIYQSDKRMNYDRL